MSNFRKEFTNTKAKASIIFDENGITYKKERNKYITGKGVIFHVFIPYRHISKIEFKFKTLLEISFYVDDKIRKIDYGHDNKRNLEFKSALSFADKQRAKSTYNGSVVIYDENSGGYINETNHIMHCEVCDHVYTYTDADLERNHQKIKDSGRAVFSSVAAGMAGHYVVSTMHSQTAQSELNGIVNYNICPNCRSRNVRRITESELDELKARKSTNTSSTSSIDELKKYKDLLDSGVITQAEFDAKKKQLLGL